MYTMVISYDTNEYEAKPQKICGRGYTDYRTVYVKKGEVSGVAIPERTTTLSINMEEVARIQAERDALMIANAPVAAKQWGLI